MDKKEIKYKTPYETAKMNCSVCFLTNACIGGLGSGAFSSFVEIPSFYFRTRVSELSLPNSKLTLFDKF